MPRKCHGNVTLGSGLPELGVKLHHAKVDASAGWGAVNVVAGRCFDGRVSSPYLRSRPYSRIREIPSLRDASSLLPLASRITRSMVRRSRTSSSVLSPCAGDADRRRQILGTNRLALAQDGRPLEDVAQLADVAGPVVVEEASIASDVMSTRQPAM